MADWSLRAAVISTDPRLRALAREVLAEPDVGVVLGLEITEPFAACGEDQVRALRQSNPDLLIVDLEDDPALGVRFTQFLADHEPALRSVAVGPELSSDLLLAAMRARVSDYLPKPVEPGALRAAVERVGRLLTHGTGAAAQPRRPGQVYAIFSAKGGAGATTVATNLAVVLHRLTNKKTLVVDLDLELGEVALALGVQPRFNLVDMVQNFHRMDANLLASYIEQHSSGVHVLSAPFHPERPELAAGDEIRRILHFLRQHYDYVVVDTPKSFSPAAMGAFEQADLILLVTNVDLPSLRNIQRGLPLLRRMLQRGADQIRLVINRYNPSSDIPVEEVERVLDLKVYWTLGNDYGAVINSINTGQPIVLNGNSKYSRDLKAMGADLAGLGKTGRGKKAARAWVGRLWGKLLRRKETKEKKA